MNIRAIALIFLLYAAHQQCAQAATPTVAEILARHRETTDAIHELKADYHDKVTWVEGSASETIGTYMKSHDVERIRQGATGDSTHDVRIENDEARTVNRNWTGSKQISYELKKHSRDRFISNGDIQIAFLIHGFPGPGTRKLTLEELYTLPEINISVKTDELDGVPCALVKLSYRTVRNIEVAIRHWHDMQNGGLILKRILETDRLAYEIRVSGIQTQNGARFPTRQAAKSFKGGKADYDEEITLTNLFINKPVPAKDLEMPTFPSGTKCNDYTSMKEYPIDSAWKPIGPAKDIVILKSTTVSDPATGDLGNASTVVEPKSTAYWIMQTSIVVAILAATALLVIRWRKSKSAS